MYVGVTVNGISSKDTERHQGGLIALWWSAPNNASIVSVAEAIFFDICELVHKIPDCATSALGRVMIESLRSTPAASASGGQAAPASLWRAASGGQQQQQHKTDT